MNPPPATRSFSLVWLVPIVALLASSWLILREFKESGPVIEIEFANGAGIEAGKTPLVYKGVVLGLVQEVALRKDLAGVIVKVELDASARPLAVADSEFWLVRPEIGLTGVKGLETLLSGARLGVKPGSGAPAKRFRGLPKAPPSEGLVPGRNFVLKSDLLNGLNPGAPVHYREVKVGVVETHRLADDATQVLVTIRVFAPYDRLVRAETRFWNSGGIDMKVGLLGAKVHSDSLESLVAGGVAFATPDSAATAEPAADGTEFVINPSPEKAWLQWAPKIPVKPDES